MDNDDTKVIISMLNGTFDAITALSQRFDLQEQKLTSLDQRMQAGFASVNARLTRVDLEENSVSNTRNMTLICEHMRKLGDPTAYVQHTGGGTATIYAGPKFINPEDDPGYGERFTLIAGPGWFEKTASKGTSPLRTPLPNSYVAKVSLEEFYYGPDDDGIVEPNKVTAEDGDELAIAHLFMRFIKQSPH